MRILLIGKYGQLGWELQRTLAPLGEILALDYPEIDLAKPEPLYQIVQEVHPQAIVNAAAYTAVDRAESEEELAMAINGRAPGLLAMWARQIGAAFVHYSTDYVFDGAKGSPYLESDAAIPINVYGRSKLAGERAVEQAGGAYLILRTSWVYSLRRDSFVTKVLDWARQQPALRVVADQVGSPTWARLLAEASAQALAKGGEGVAGWIGERRGLYHLAGDGVASRLEWAQAILRLDPQRAEQVTREVRLALTEEFPTPARRPLYSALDCRRFEQVFGIRLPPWETALQLAMEIR